ncbi:unnamed protein product [Peniophora sp. CBMAI 1063]|nr:unnamed protein product [Peniophora sp. CBMAI 1063]
MLSGPHRRTIVSSGHLHHGHVGYTAVSPVQEGRSTSECRTSFRRSNRAARLIAPHNASEGCGTLKTFSEAQTHRIPVRVRGLYTWVSTHNRVKLTAVGVHSRLMTRSCFWWSHDTIHAPEHLQSNEELADRALS